MMTTAMVATKMAKRGTKEEGDTAAERTDTLSVPIDLTGSGSREDTASLNVWQDKDWRVPKKPNT